MNIFPAGSLIGLSTSQPISRTVDFRGNVAFIVTNASPAFFSLTDDNGQVQAIIPPFSTVQGTVNESTANLSMSANYDLPQVQAVGVTAAQWAITLEVGAVSVPPSVTPLSVASAISNVAVNASGQTVVEVVGGSVDVTQAAGDVLNVGGTIKVGNSTLNVTTATGDSVTVAGTIDIGNTPAVTVESGSVAVTSGTVDATIQNASLDTQSTIVNEYVSTSTLVSFGTQTIDVASLANGSSVGANFSLPDNQLGFYDGLFFSWESAQGVAYTQGDCYGWTNLNGQNNITTPNITPNNQEVGFFGSGQVFERIGFNLVNNTGAEVTTDTITVSAWALKGTITNPTSAPVYQQDAIGGFDEFYSISQTLEAGTQVTLTLVPTSVGGYIKYLVLTYLNDNTDAYLGYLDVGGNGEDLITTIPAASSTLNAAGMLFPPLEFKTGVANGGVTLTIGVPAGTTGNITIGGYAIYTQTQGSNTPATLQ